MGLRRNVERDRAALSESGFSGFHFGPLAVFAITGDSSKTNADERLTLEDDADES